MYAEDDLLPISALQHLVFCERQCALIHLEHMWSENLLTAKGRTLHERVDRGGDQARDEMQIRYGLQLRSLEMGLSGKADAVEFHPLTTDQKNSGIYKWQPYPIEYKRGKPKFDDCDKVQLCAQAMCLEEMLKVQIPEGALFYGTIRRRQTVSFNTDLRSKTKSAAIRLHELIKTGRTPSPVYTSKCDSCSLIEQCMPQICMGNRSAKGFLDKLISET